MKRALAVIALVSFALVLIGCAAPASTQSSRGSVPGAPPAQPLPAATAAPELYGKRQADTGAGLDQSIPNAQSTERMIVYTVRVRLEVQDTEKAVTDITAIVSQHKGYVSGAEMTRDSQGRMYGTLTVRIPAASLDTAQQQIEGTALRVQSRNRNSSDVTDQYTDLNARLTNLEATEKELRELLATTRERTGKAEDILAIYNRLTEVRGQIEQIKGQMNVLSKTSEFATMTIELTPQAQVVEPEGWLASETAREALRALVQTLQALASLAIWVILYMLPLFIILMIPLGILALILRGLIRRRIKQPASTAG